ncbi:Aste57867_9674 [Aphanomyces stellatus]|uniref:Hexose transporter 1 n=1 Tax=Aphanomyces stellatus TaxID=120398 RepID=A0A485KNJ2_9STRA|nr:hypothetical protein As57867_009636 [Aphanomyces stellatus]VFT86553.1 Aste57867_9674 [Aphanomyces stellatus]
MVAQEGRSSPTAGAVAAPLHVAVDAAVEVEALATPKQIDDNDVYVDIGDEGDAKPMMRTASYRSLHRHSSRQLLSRLESSIHPEHSKALLPTTVLYVTILIALIGSFQTGWLLTQLNYLPFSNAKHCAATPIAPHTCILFPGHSKREWTMAVTGWVLGAAVGAVGSGLPADKFGRKRTMFFNAFVMIVGGIVQAMAQDIYLFAVGRFISGVATGTVINVSNVLISEVSPCQMRGLFTAGIQVGVALGSLTVTSTHYFIGTGNVLWRFMVGFPIVFGTIQILLMPFMCQSPVWLVAQNKVTEAGAAMRRLYQPTDFESILDALVHSHEEEAAELAKVNLWGSFFSRKYLRQVAIAVVLCTSQQFNGINAVMYYSATIFYSAGVTDPRVANTIINVVRTLAVFGSAKTIDKFNRRTIIIAGMTTMGLASTGLVIALINGIPALAIASVSIFVAAWGLSIGPCAWMVSAEIFPDFLRANAGSVGTMFTWLSNFTVAVVYPTLASEDNLGNYAFTIFIGFCVAYILFVVFCLPETGGKTYVEIARSFGIEEAEHHLPEDHDPWAKSRVSSPFSDVATSFHEEVAVGDKQK